MSLLYEKNLRMLPKTDIALSFNRQNISATQHKLQYDTGVAMQDNAAQHWWYSAILAAIQPSSLKLRKFMMARSSL